MVSTIVYADDGGNGGNGCGGGNGSGNGNGGNRGGDAGHSSNSGGDAGHGANNGGDASHGSNDGGDAGKGGIGSGDGKDGIGGRDAGNSNSGDRSSGDSNGGNSGGVNGGHGSGGGSENSHYGHVNDRNAVHNPRTSDQKSTSNASHKTAMVPHVTLAPTIQAPAVALLVTYSAETTPSASGTWGSLVEYVEELFRKFLFLSGSIGEKIRRKEVLRNRKRREIYYFIVNNPFSHFRRITRMVRAGPNQCFWHLRILEKMGLIKSEHVGRYLTYHANNSDYIGSRGNRPATISNSNATKILEYLRSNPGVKIAHLSQVLMMNRHTVSYHIKCMLTSGLVERVERNTLRLSLVERVENHGERLTHQIARPVVVTSAVPITCT